jgi:hypothetical protein
MRLMILRMLSSNALSAFGSSSPLSPPGQAGPVHRVRALSGQAAQGGTKPEVPNLKLSLQPGEAPSGRLMPRGSLLDLSV